MHVRSTAVIVLTVILMVLAGPAVAGPPERVDNDWYFVYPDPHNLVAFVNITRPNYCAWEVAGFPGLAPVNQLVPQRSKETDQGAVVLSFHAEAAFELWRPDEDPPSPPSECGVTQGQDAPWATGTGHFAWNDNNVFESPTRTASWGGRVQASLTDADGSTWRYSGAARFQIDKDGDLHVRVFRATLVKTS